MKIKKITKIDYKEDVYNLRIEDNHNYFANDLCVSNCHTAKTTSVKKVLSKCKNADIRFGLSGTIGIDKDDADAYTLLSLIGPCVNKVSAKFLFGNNEENKQYATPVYIRQIMMDYLPYDKRNDILKLKAKRVEFDGSTMLALEKKLIVDNKDRLNFIVDVISKVQNNSLVLFHNVQDGYGKQICDALKHVLPTNYEIYYVDGETKQDLRKHYITQMDRNTKSIKIMVASFGTFSTGISINNLSYIFFTESFKSEKIILQSIGRGMRLFEGKEVVNIIDFVDDFSFKGFQNYSLKHSYEREEIYKTQGFPYKKIKKTFGERLK